jgi:hypothetical protein
VRDVLDSGAESGAGVVTGPRYTVADLRARTAALQDAVDRHRDDPRWRGQPLDALRQRLEELDAAVLRLSDPR